MPTEIGPLDQTIPGAFSDSEGDRKREQSTIAFPYLDLDAAVEVARAVYNRSGLGTCDLDELAAQMGQTISGAFRLKTGTAKIFDLVDREGRSGIKLSELGRQIISGAERSARAEAFLRVPLYAGIYDKYRGHFLPPPKALEREMIGLGVSSKQADKARQAFERSARQAGFFDHGDDRLVRPKTELMPSGQEEATVNQSGDVSNPSNDYAARAVKEMPSATGKNHPLIQGLLITLPEPGQDWDSESRAAWLRMAASIFEMIYKGTVSPVVVTVQKNTGH